MNLISFNKVSYSKKKNEILKSINFTIKEGEILGLVGENGAGKSTLLKILAGMLKPSEGNLIFFDTNIGFLIEEPNLYPYKTGRDHLEYIMKINNCFNKVELNNLANLLDIEDILDKKIKKYSLGMKQKLGIISAAIGNQSLIILDEPTNSLDYNTIPKLRNLIAYLNSQGKTIIITSHILTEIEKICDRVLIIKNGELMDDFKVQNKHGDLEKYVVKEGYL